MNNNNTIIVLPDQMRFYELLKLKQMLKLEIAGMKHSKGINAAKLIRALIGSKTKNKADLLKEYVVYLEQQRVQFTATDV